MEMFRYVKFVYVLLSKILDYVFKQEKQCTHNVTLRRVRVTLVAVEKR